jgi:hypothetical protein
MPGLYFSAGQILTRNEKRTITDSLYNKMAFKEIPDLMTSRIDYIVEDSHSTTIVKKRRTGELCLFNSNTKLVML